MELFVELQNENGVQKVHEGVSHVASVSEVNRKIKKVIVVFVLNVDLGHQHFLIVLIWNVLNHYSSAIISLPKDVRWLQLEQQLIYYNFFLFLVVFLALGLIS